MEATQHSLLAACITLHSINATLAIVPQRGMETLTYWSLPCCSLVCWSGSGADWLAGRTLSDVPFTLELHRFSRERDRLLMAASFTLPLLLLLLWIFPATAPFPTGS
jgi:hypothetical protein